MKGSERVWNRLTHHHLHSTDFHTKWTDMNLTKVNTRVNNVSLLLCWPSKRMRRIMRSLQFGNLWNIPKHRGSLTSVGKDISQWVYKSKTNEAVKYMSIKYEPFTQNKALRILCFYWETRRGDCSFLLHPNTFLLLLEEASKFFSFFFRTSSQTQLE